jgi:hypothetical protein
MVEKENHEVQAELVSVIDCLRVCQSSCKWMGVSETKTEGHEIKETSLGLANLLSEAVDKLNDVLGYLMDTEKEGPQPNA